MLNSDIINAALKEIYVLADEETPTARQSADALNMLNRMMAQWAIEDKDINFPPQDTLGATAPIPMWAEDAVITNLALYLNPQFKGSITQELYDRAVKSRARVAANLINTKLDNTDMSHMPQGDSNSRWDIETDT